MIGPNQYPASLAIEEERLCRVIAAHEAGHGALYSLLDILAEAALEVDGGGSIVGGITLPEAGTLTEIQKSAIGWSGIMAEYLLGFVANPWPQIPPLTAQSLDQWRKAVWGCSYASLSEEDREMILPGSDNLKSAEYAFSMLSSSDGSQRLRAVFDLLSAAFLAARSGAGAAAVGVGQAREGVE